VTEQRQEILDWYHLKENLYKAGGSLKWLKQAESLLWFGQVNEVINLFKDLKKQAFKRLCNYLETHRYRIINYLYYQEESLSSIGSGTVELTIKQIGFRVKLSGASVEYWECCIYPFSSLCLSQWSTFHLIYLQNWDAPLTKSSWPTPSLLRRLSADREATMISSCPV
jgi:hypothetical protein